MNIFLLLNTNAILFVKKKNMNKNHMYNIEILANSFLIPLKNK